MIRDRLKRGARRLKRGIRRRLVTDTIPVHNQTVSEPILSVAPVSIEPEPAPTEETPSPGPPPPEEPPGVALTVENVQALFEDMVRPALQSDGGDIDLVKVEGDDVYVRLTGACSTCSSSTVTMKMGVERLLVEEFPTFNNLIQVFEPA